MIRAIGKNTCEESPAWTMVSENDAQKKGVNNSQLETACLQLAEAGSPYHRSDSNRQLLLVTWASLDNHLDDNVCPTVRVTPPQIVGRTQRPRQ